MRNYYGIDSYELQNNSGSVYSWSNIENFYGTIEFDEKYTILLYERWFDDKDKNRHFCMGMPIEEMIQF